MFADEEICTVSIYWAPIQAIPKLAVNQDDCINQLYL
jgi:hypothetical protein